MTVKECYEQAVGFLPENPEENTGMQKYAVSWCNFLLAETFQNENICRKAKKLPQITEIPKVSDMGEEIPYDEEMVRAVFPYGMARWAFRESEDVSGSREYYRLYAVALAEATPVTEEEIEDVYG
ncbi:MAG: hypothetical protein IJE28_00395 [Oscillospiraceae bacterium]|nr:hypothetical protein [Oscillospiraceae bacterium]MBQ3501400.1 hypothetical protein [Oscillospiraceae bacterium]MBQ4642835.1 hypothetical protein [Oscillospiraceae bacterium]